MNEITNKIKEIRAKYGDTVFRCSIQHLIDCGIHSFTKDGVKRACDKIRKGEKNQTGVPIMTPDFRCEIVHCAAKLAEIPVWDLICYIKDYVPCQGTRDSAMELENNDTAEQGMCPRCGFQFDEKLIYHYQAAFCPACGQAISI